MSCEGKAAPSGGRREPGGFMRHVRACNNATLPGRRLPFRLVSCPRWSRRAAVNEGEQPAAENSDPGTGQVGWVLPAFAAALERFPSVAMTSDGVCLSDPGALPGIARALADRGLLHWRGEAFDVRARPDGPVLAVLDRGALPAFGVEAAGVHVNGLVEGPEGPHLWVGRRAAHKSLDPGKLDHIVAGGVPSGLTPAQTLVKEAAEEAAIPPGLAEQAKPVATIRYTMERPEGLRRDVLYCYDLMLRPEFRPYPRDGEVAAFELWPLPAVVEAVRSGEAFKFNVNLVLIDLFLRRGLLHGAAAAGLRVALSGARGAWG
ncbi:MAG: DUF4743 domain-containing protein [Acetobacteraceae bacterium]